MQKDTICVSESHHNVIDNMIRSLQESLQLQIKA